jgi:hypothetical protein
MPVLQANDLISYRFRLPNGKPAQASLAPKVRENRYLGLRRGRFEAFEACRRAP